MHNLQLHVFAFHNFLHSLNSDRVLELFLFFGREDHKKVTSVNYIFIAVSCGHNFWQLQMMISFDGNVITFYLRLSKQIYVTKSSNAEQCSGVDHICLGLARVVVIQKTYALASSNTDLKTLLKGNYKFSLLGLILNGVYIKTEGVNLKPGCQSVGSCGNCGAGSCSKEWDGKTCRCPKGFTGPNCIDVCALNPCLNEGLCRRSSTAIHGFTCNCKPSFTGRYSIFRHSSI